MFYVAEISGRERPYVEKTSNRVESVRPAAKITRDLVDFERDELPQKKNPYEKIDQPPKKRERITAARDIMSSPVFTIREDIKIRDTKKFFEEKRYRHIPVVSEENKLIGILSDRDYLRSSDKDITVKECMTSEVVTTRPETDIREIANILFKERIGAMPIVNEDGNLVGILTRSDILCAVVNRAPLELWA